MGVKKGYKRGPQSKEHRKRISVSVSKENHHNWVELGNEKNNIIDMYKNKGLCLFEISKHYNLGKFVIRRILVENNVKIRIGRFRKDVLNNKEKIILFYKNNISVKEIAEKFNCSKSMIYSILDKENVLKKTKPMALETKLKISKIMREKAKNRKNTIRNILNENSSCR